MNTQQNPQILVNNLELTRNGIDNSVHKSVREGIPYCEAGVLTAVSEYILEVKKLQDRFALTDGMKKFQAEYACDCDNCKEWLI